MFQKKSPISESNQDKTILGEILWFIENYLPQKNKRLSHSRFLQDKFKSFSINNIKKLDSNRSKSLGKDLINSKITFTVGNWAIPYLNLLKRIKLLK